MAGNEDFDPAGLRILVVDDNELTLHIMRHMLQGCNYLGQYFVPRHGFCSVRTERLLERDCHCGPSLALFQKVATFLFSFIRVAYLGCLTVSVRCDSLVCAESFFGVFCLHVYATNSLLFQSVRFGKQSEIIFWAVFFVL